MPLGFARIISTVLEPLEAQANLATALPGSDQGARLHLQAVDRVQQRGKLIAQAGFG